MGLMNYTTKIGAAESLGEIQQMLLKAGATDIMIKAEKGEPVGLSFAIETEAGPRPFLMPARVGGVLAVLQRQHKAGELRSHGKAPDEAQARRTAWRNLRDWCSAQLAIVEAGQVKVEEVFLPYLIIGRGNFTLYEAMSENHLLLPAAEG